MRGAERHSTTARDQAQGRTAAARCGAATTDPWPTADELEAAYGDWYRPAGGKPLLLRAATRSSGRTRGAARRPLDSIAPPGPVLDVGAGDGTLLDALRRHGREATGLERESMRADFLDEPLEDVERRLGGGRVLALARAPAGSRRGDSRRPPGCSRPGGVIVVAVPNSDSLQARLFGDRWLHLDLPRHLVHLSAASLRHGPGADGFAIERVSLPRGGQIVIGWLDGLVGSLPGDPDLYQALRRPAGRKQPHRPRPGELLAIAAGVAAAAGRAAVAPRSRWRCGAAAPSTLRRGVAERETAGTRRPKVIVVMPARQAAATLRETVAEIPLEHVDEIILVDDSSTDETVELARELPVEVVWHPHQVGYGGNQKTCYLQALHHDADVVVMLHPDGQYEPGLIPA